MAQIFHHQHTGNRTCLPEINFNCFDRSGQGNFSLLRENQSGEEMKETEDVLASELSKLTMKERIEAMDDLHCVGNDLEETPELIEQSLEMFDKAVQDENDPSYGMAASQNQAYVEDRSFRLRFIRTNFHDTGKAVKHMFHFLRNKAKYFGTDCLGRDITMNDLNEEDRKLLWSGIYHVQADRDQKGRVVVYALSDLIGRCSGVSLCRIAYYIYNNVLGTIPEVEMKGVVFIFYDTTKNGDTPAIPSFSSSAAFMDMVKCVPVRFSAMHYCMKPRNDRLRVFDPILKLVCSLTEEYSRVRTRLHYGSDLEVQYQIRGHGINTKSCPINSDGAIREDILSVWLQDYLKMKEPGSNIPVAQASEPTLTGSSALFSFDDHVLDFGTLHHSLDHDAEDMFGNYSLPSTSGGIQGEQEKHGINATLITPTESDILLGRGKFAQNNPGNIKFRHFVEIHKEEYDRASRRRRREIIAEMSKTLASKGVRFLKQMEKDVWTKSTVKEAETKIAQLFREFRKQK